MKRKAVLLAALGVFVLAVVAHAPAVGGGWVFDDHRFIELNPSLEQLDAASYFTDASTASASEGIQHDIYRPIRTLSYALEAQLFGREDPRPAHVLNVLLHALTALLVFRLLLRLVPGSWPAAAVGAGVFAVHPVTVESVAWVSSRGDILAVLFMVAALLAFEREGWGRTVMGVTLGALACFAKESALVLPALLLLRDLALPTGHRVHLRTTILRLGLLGIVVALYLVARGQVVGELAQVASFPGGSRVATARGMLAGYGWYVKALVWPSGFPFDLHLSIPASFADPRVVVGAGLLLTTFAAGLWGMVQRDARLLTFAAWGFLACLVPVSNLIVPLKALVAERFLYPGLVCAVAAIAWAVTRLRGRWRVAALAAVTLAMLALVPLTWQRTRAWESDSTLWETVLRERPSHMRAYEGLAYEYRHRGRVHDAEVAFRSYLDFNPADGKAMFELGTVIGSIADALRIDRPQPGVQTDVAERRRMTRTVEIGWYRAALETWARIGLVQGRGSPALLARVHRARIAAAMDLGDLNEARLANDDLIRLAGVDPADAAAVFRDAPIENQRVRLHLAVKAVTTPSPPGLDRAGYEARNAARARVLEGVGIPPVTPDRPARRALLPRYQALAETDGATVEDRLRYADLLEEFGQKAEAERLRADLRRAHPTHPLLSEGRR